MTNSTVLKRDSVTDFSSRRTSVVTQDSPLEVRVSTAVATIREHWSVPPRVGIVLGTGLGGFAKTVAQSSFNEHVQLSFDEIPHFPCPTALGHQGRLIGAQIGDVPIAVLQGRCHLYEGRTLDDVTFSMRVLHELGVEHVILSCAAGGLNSQFETGDLMLLADHLDFFMLPNSRSFPRSADIYDTVINRRVMMLARRQNIPLQCGTYMAVRGPNYETRAELRFFKKIADAIGMSTIPEAKLARELGMSVTAIATITNLCNPDQRQIADGHQVLHVSEQAAPRFERLVLSLLKELEIASRPTIH